VELSPITFEHQGKEYKCRRITVGDYSAIRERIRRDRLAAVPPGASPEITAIVIARPVTNDEISDYMISTEGQAMLLGRCIKHYDQTATQQMVDELVMSNDPVVIRLYRESGVLPPDPTTSTPQPEN